MPLFFQRLAALAALILPPWVAVQAAIAFADALYGSVEAWLAPSLARLNALPSLPAALLAGDYGIVAMLPFLFLYALPTAVVFAVLAEAYRQAGLLERLGALLHPWTLRIGLEGKDLITVLMGFGCNVPALHSARACNSCTKEACMSAIAFGAACSYQHPATLAVLAAAGRGDLAAAYLGLLVLSTALFLRVFYGGPGSPAAALPLPPPALPLAWPRPLALLRHGGLQSADFVKDVATVFAGVCLLAAFAAWSGLLSLLERAAAPWMMLLGLPVQVADAVVMSAVRKNGMATILIDPAGGLKLPLGSASQLLAAVLLAGMLLPCIVTSLALGKELGWKRTGRLLLRQALTVSLMVAVLSWSGRLIGF
jgi:Fe2+ transport system protein B